MIYKELDILFHTSCADYSSRTHKGNDPVPTEGRKKLSGVFQGFLCLDLCLNACDWKINLQSFDSIDLIGKWS